MRMRMLGSLLQVCNRRRARIALARGLEPIDDAQLTRGVLGNGRAAFDPIAAVQVLNACDLAARRMMNVAAHHAVHPTPARFGCKGILELADEVHGGLDLELEI